MAALALGELERRLEENDQRHREAVVRLRAEASALRARLTSLAAGAKDSTFVRAFEWRIDDLAARCGGMSKDDSLWSEEFAIMGVPGLQLEFFPRGRASTRTEGFCALFLWCRAGVRVKYQLRVGGHQLAPEEDEYPTRMGKGQSNFCCLEAQRDALTDSVVVGVDVLELTTFREPSPGLRLVNRGPERLVARGALELHSWHLDTVEWRIRGLLQRRASLPAGVALCSPLFSLAGVPDMLLELYPSGVGGEGAVAADGGASCGFYVRCPAGTALMLTLFVGKATLGPLKTEFKQGEAQGRPAFCKLEEQLEPGADDLVVGVTVKNLRAEQQERRTTLELE
ncbi:unnamed protein product [Prorocentrum cordatum]|uniref:Uncharacterized protein n=1 Tax=Prorocentrum cordatum TaxID=2364126 RepID=A0ABN9R997_9DINO|nr:unnamed protein product [Polarella glacialis]